MAQTDLDKTAHVVGIDIGGTGIKGAPVDLELGRLSGDRVRIPTPHPATPGAVADAVVKVLDQIGVPGPVGLTLPAVIRGGKVQTASNIDPAWMQTNVAELFAGATGRDVGVVNDADAAGIAEIRFGAGKGRKGIVVLVTLGTGIGSAVFSHGVLVPNTELGHLRLHREDAEDWAAESVREHDDLSWKKWAKRLQEYFERVELLLWPDLIIIGGGVSQSADKFLPHIELSTEIVPAQMFNDAGIVGAALFAPTGQPIPPLIRFDAALGQHLQGGSQ